MKNDYDIAELYKEMELHLIRSMQRNLGRHLKDEIAEGKEWKMWQAEKLKELKRYQRQNKDIVNFYTSNLSKDIAEILKEEFKQGHKSEIKKYNKLFDKKVSDSFFKLNDRKANVLIDVVNNDLDEANKAVLRMMNDEYRQTIHKAATFASNGVMTQKQAVDMATKDFLSRGLAVIEYKDGKRVNIASYAQMAVRTASQRAMLMGEGEFRKSIGETNVIISKHGTACKLCQPHESKVYIDDVYSGGKADGKYELLSNAMKQGLFHPNCRHGISTYYGLDEEDEEETTVNVPKDNNKEDAARLDREIQKEKRKVAGFQSPDNLKTAKQRLKELEAQKVINESKIIKDLESRKIEYNEVKKLNKKLTTDEIVAKIGGGDMTGGSCSSVAFAYIGNKNGLDVLDFRGGDSLNYFSKSGHIMEIANIKGVKCVVDENYNDILSAINLLKTAEEGKEYYLSIGNHASIVRKKDNIYEYLELQTEKNNGFKKLSNEILKKRFGCRQSHTIHGLKLKYKNVLIDIDSFKDNVEFEKMLGYLNTATEKQTKGAAGYAK